MLSYLLPFRCDVWDGHSARLSLITCLFSASFVAVKGLIVVAWDKGIHSNLINDRSGHAKQTPPWPWGQM